MRTIFFIASLLLFSANTLAQKKSPIKYNSKSVKIQYFHLPELENKENHERYRIHISAGDLKLRYTTLTPIKPLAANVVVFRSGLLLPKKPCSEDNCDLDITIHAESQETGARKAVHKEEKIKRPDGSTIKQKRHSYDFEYTQTIHIIVKDKRDNDKELRNEKITFSGTYNWPRDFNNGNGSTTISALERAYTVFTAKENFKDIQAKAMLEGCLSADGGEYLESLIVRNKAVTNVWTWVPKTKDTRFAPLDSAYFYLNAGLDAMKENKKNKVFLNAHEKTAYNHFDNAFRIFSSFDHDYVLELLGNEAWTKEFINYNRIPLIMSALFSSHYEEAVNVVEGHSVHRNKEAQEIEDSDKELKKAVLEVSSALSSTGLINQQIEAMLPILVREIRFYDEFKVKYDYYK
ncbi:MAG: hypothetical protein ACJA0U_002738 [Salibacteraceae bacterium]|jgi:hypothetical protein